MKSKILLSLLAIIPLCGCNVKSEYHYDNADQYVEYKEAVTIDNNDLDSLIVNWVSGDVIINQKDGPLSFKETTGNASKYLPLYYRTFNNGVEIQFVKSGTDNDLVNNLQKTVEITVPLHYTDIYINTVSADSVININTMHEIDFNSVSGNLKAEINQVTTFLSNTVSGNIDITLKDTSTTHSIEINTVSGNSKLYLDSNRGYKLNKTTVSGKIKDNFNKSDENPYRIDFNSVSGDLELNKYELE